MTILQKITKNKLKIVLTVVLFAIAGILITTQSSGETGDSDTIEPRVPNVSLINLQSVENQESFIESTGEVKAQSSAEIRSQASELVISKSVRLGDSVYSGQTLVVLDTSVIDAQISQAKAGIDQQELRLIEIERGARSEELDIAHARLAAAQTQLSTAQASLLDKVQDGITKADDAVHNKIDPLFTNARTDFPELNFLPYSYQLKVDLERLKPVIDDTLSEWQTTLMNLNETDDLTALAYKAELDLKTIKVFVDSLADAVNALTPSNALTQTTISGWKADLSLTRSGINAAISALSGASDGYAGALAGLVIAEEEINLVYAGATDEQISIQKSALDSATASLEGLIAQRNKLIITTPISGTVSKVNVELGELVSLGQLVARIVNTSSYSVTTFVDPTVVDVLYSGQPVRIDDVFEGKVARISPSVDPISKKVEVEINITDSVMNPVSGSFVSIKYIVTEDNLSIPLSAIRSTGEGDFVFTVDGAIVTEIPVTLGEIRNDRVEIISGLENVSHIIDSSRGRSAGEMVQTN